MLKSPFKKKIFSKTLQIPTLKSRFLSKFLHIETSILNKKLATLKKVYFFSFFKYLIFSFLKKTLHFF